MRNSGIKTISKEEINFLQFPKEEVLPSQDDRHQRCITIKRAMALGNLEREKVGILFQDSEGLKKVETTVWGVTDKVVILKKSTVIPLSRIYSVS